MTKLKTTAGWLVTGLLLLFAFTARASEREVTITAPDGTTLAGTLTIPDKGVKGSVVFISGSDATDRNETIGPLKPFLTISKAVTDAGYATLRLDDRGTGASKGDAKTTDLDTEAADISAALAWIRTQPELKNLPAGVFGHSQGGAVALMLTDKRKNYTRPSFIITYGAPAIKGTDMMLAQVEAMMKGQEPVWQQMKPILSRRYALVASDIPQQELIDKLTADVMDQIPEAQRSNPALKARIDAEVAQMSSIPYRSLLRYDPSPLYKDLNTRWIALYGENDQQAPPDANMLPSTVQNIASWIFIPGLNHIGQATSNGSPALYTTLGKDVDKSLTDAIVFWLDNITGNQ